MMDDTVKFNERMFPTSECRSCAKPSLASFAYCPHCGTRKTA